VETFGLGKEAAEAKLRVIHFLGKGKQRVSAQHKAGT